MLCSERHGEDDEENKYSLESQKISESLTVSKEYIIHLCEDNLGCFFDCSQKNQEKSKNKYM